MTGQKLLDFLRSTGTGLGKLVHAVALLKSNPGAAAVEVVEALRKGGAAEGTIKKCEEFLGVSIVATDAGDKPVFPVRAPMGGVRIGDKQYVPGEIIPPDVVASATPDLCRELCRGSTAIGAQAVVPAAEPGAVTLVPPTSDTAPATTDSPATDTSTATSDTPPAADTPPDPKPTLPRNKRN